MSVSASQLLEELESQVEPVELYNLLPEEDSQPMGEGQTSKVPDEDFAFSDIEASEPEDEEEDEDEEVVVIRVEFKDKTYFVQSLNKDAVRVLFEHNELVVPGSVLVLHRRNNVVVRCENRNVLSLVQTRALERTASAVDEGRSQTAELEKQLEKVRNRLNADKQMLQRELLQLF